MDLPDFSENYFAKEEAREKQAMMFRVIRQVNKLQIGMRGIVVGIFPIADYGYSILVQCTSRKRHTFKALLNKTQYLNCVEEIPIVPDPIIIGSWVFRQQW